MKPASCIREEIDQRKIENYEKLIRDFNTEFKRIGNVISLIGNEVRLKLIWLLNEERFCVCDLADILQMSVPAISQHLRKLKDAGIVESQREKQTLYYRISDSCTDTVNHILALAPAETI